MIAVIAGTNRPASNTLKIAHVVPEFSTTVVKPSPCSISPSCRRTSWPAPATQQTRRVRGVPGNGAGGRGILTVVPEYNGSYPGVLKYFIDMLRFPGKPV